MKNEKYITIQNERGSKVVYVRIRKLNIRKRFSIAEYGSEKEALEAAKLFRNKAVAQDIAQTKVNAIERKKYSVEFAFNRSQELSNNSFKTKYKHQVIFNKYFKSVRDIPITKIKPLDISKMMGQCATECSDDTLKKIKNVWNRLFNAAVLDEVVMMNYCSVVPAVRSFRPLKPKSSNLVNQDTLKAIKQYLSNSKISDYRQLLLAIEIMECTGIRPSECFALTIDCFDFEHNTLTIKQRVGSNQTERNAIVSPKTANALRTLPFDVSLKNRIIEALKQHDGYLFRRKNGELFNSDYSSSVIRMIVNHRNLPNFNLYMLRHNAAKQLIDGGVNPRTVQDYLGHASFEQSVYYSETTDAELQEAFKKLLN